MSFGISTMVQDRVEVFHLWAANVRKYFPGALVSVAYSQSFYKPIIEAYGFSPIFVSNDNLSHKANASCLNLKGKVSKVLFLGSDDVVNSSLAFYYQGFVGDFLAMLDCYFHNLETGETKYWPGYSGKRTGEPIGAGKLASAYLLELLQWQPFGYATQYGLDGRFHQKIEKLTRKGIIHPVYRKLEEVDGLLVDLKTQESLTPWKHITGVNVMFELNKL